MQMTPRASIGLPPPHAVKRKVSLHELIVLPSKLLEDGVRHQVDGSTAIDEHPGDWLSVDVAPNVQCLQVLARLFGLLEHDLLGDETPLNSAGNVNTMLMSMPVGGGDPSLINGASSSSSRFMSSSEVVGAGVSTFSFTLHSCFVGITGRMMLKYSSLFVSAASSLIFRTLIHWILLLWLGVSPGGHQRGAGVILGAVVLDGCFWLEAAKTGWSGLVGTDGSWGCHRASTR
jgi:hypothetical protein